MRTLFVFLLALCLAVPAAAGSLAGVTLPDKVDADGKSLVLNGMALRKKFVIKVYVGGFYLPQRERSGQGTRVEVAGKAKGTLPGAATADAILATWIGPEPGPGEEFKQELLGG